MEDVPDRLSGVREDYIVCDYASSMDSGRIEVVHIGEVGEIYLAKLAKGIAIK